MVKPLFWYRNFEKIGGGLLQIMLPVYHQNKLLNKTNDFIWEPVCIQLFAFSLFIQFTEENKQLLA